MRLLRRLLPVLIVISCLVLPPAARAVEASTPPAAGLADVQSRADAALARADLTAYRGWIKFLRFEAETAVTKHGATSAEAQAKVKRFAEWVDRISANPNLLATLTGVQEWAYESRVDGSGQPFKMAIPTDYDPKRPAPLSLYMHGYAGNHLEHATGMAAHLGSLDLSVLGRSRGGGYRALSEADVLDVISYVQAHWAIDPDRIHINGGSMGGGGTYRLGARYPQLFASGRPSCGYADYVPVGNLLTLPLYATHSADDPVVSVLHEVGPLARLRELGGRVIFDETNGYGHAVWDYKEGNARGAAWEPDQVRPDSRTVRHIDYTATDGGAMRGWWGEIIEWGDAPRPARFVLAADADNLLHAELSNINQFRVRLAESPFDRTQPLHVSVNGAVPFTVPAPLPESVGLVRGEKGWTFETKDEALPFRRHTPGSAPLLYNGDPLLIVYGTQGDAAAAMRSAAVVASKSPNAVWIDDSGPAGPEGVPHSQNLYGNLEIKADTAVTDADIARCHLVLIGTAEQNTVVARMADKLPVHFAAKGGVDCDDGVKFDGAHQAMGLVHFNPLAPSRLVFWVASSDPAAYAAGSLIPRFMGGGSFIAASGFGADLLVMDATGPTIVGVRSFTSRWKWSAERALSPPVPAAIKTYGDLSAAMGAAARRTVEADFALVDSYGPADLAPVTAGVTRVSDLTALFYNLPIGSCEMTGAELTELTRKTDAEGTRRLYVLPAIGTGKDKLDPTRLYRVALPIDVLWTISGLVQPPPRNYRQTDLLAGDALERYLGKPE
jgi:hypothetical protein